MRNIRSFAWFAWLLFFLLFLSAAGALSMPVALAQNATPDTTVWLVTPTPPVENSEIGSTDGILLMGVVIILIVTLPLVFYKRNKSL